MRRWFVLGVLLITSCTDEDPPEQSWPVQWSEAGDPVVDAWQVWRQGSGYFKVRLRQALLESRAPERYRYRQGLLLTECDAPEAVPILCETVAQLSRVDRALPSIVRPDQQAAAEKAIHAALERLGGSDGH